MLPPRLGDPMEKEMVHRDSRIVEAGDQSDGIKSAFVDVKTI